MMSRWAVAVLALSAIPLGARSQGAPDGYRPPPGMCRIWIDGVPADRQPAPTDCATAVRRRPSNAHVIFGDLSTTVVSPGPTNSTTTNASQAAPLPNPAPAPGAAPTPVPPGAPAEAPRAESHVVPAPPPASHDNPAAGNPAHMAVPHATTHGVPGSPPATHSPPSGTSPAKTAGHPPMHHAGG